MIIELKNDKSADTAIKQIKEKRYTGALSGYTDEIILVGISYDNGKGHSCVIEKMTPLYNEESGYPVYTPN